MPVHFGIKLPQRAGGHALTRANCICTTKDGRYYFEDDWLKRDPSAWEAHRAAVMRNYDLTMAYCERLPQGLFADALDDVLRSFPCLEEVRDLNEWRGVRGAYLLVLDEYKQFYVGQATSAGGIRQRIMVHWQKKPAFDRMLSGPAERSIMSIDCFRAFDTTHIFAASSDDPGTLEREIQKRLPAAYCANRTRAGDLAGGLAEAIAQRRERDLLGDVFAEDDRGRNKIRGKVTVP